MRGMRMWLGAGLVLAVVGQGRAQAIDRADDSRCLAIVHANVLPMTSDTVLSDHAVLVRNDRIVEVIPMARFEAPAGAEVLDAAGRYVLPGLVDFHVHLRAESELASYLRHGVTTVVNMRGTPAHLEAREALRRGELVGPRLFTTGPLLDGDPPIWSGDATRVVTSPAEARAAVSEHVAAGYDFVKVYNNLDPAVLEVVVEEARAANLAVVGHLPRRPVREEGLSRALEAGIDMIAHGEEVFFTHFGGAPDSLMRTGGYVPPTADEIHGVAERIAAAGVAVTPNLSFIEMTARMLVDLEAVLDDAEFERLEAGVRETWRERNPIQRPDIEAFAARERVKSEVVRRLTKALHEAGAPLLAGTDAAAPGMYPGKSLHVEIAELTEAGLEPFEALLAASGNAGDFLAAHLANAPRLGRVTSGYAADLLIVDEDPRAVPRALAHPWQLVVRGRVLPSGERPEVSHCKHSCNPAASLDP